MNTVDQMPPRWPEYDVPLSEDFEWTPMDRSAPIAIAQFFDQPNRVWIVQRCPYCGGRHEHSAGEAGTDHRASLGGRESHCHSGGEYRLVDVDSSWARKNILTTDRITVLPPKSKDSPSRPPMPSDLRADVWDKSRGFCWYCGVELHPFRNFHVDHYIPVVDGGSNDIANLVPSCQSCNSRKHARPAEYLRRFIGSGVFWFERAGKS